MRILVIIILLLISINCQGEPSNNLLYGLIGWWSSVPGLTESNTFYDLTLGENNGTLTGMGYSPTSGWSGTIRPRGYAQLNFDGVDDLATISHNAIFTFGRTNTFSISFWIATSSGSARAIVIGKYQSTSPWQGWIIELRAGKICFIINDVSFNTLDLRTNGTINDNLWHHVMVTYIGNSLEAGQTIYIDGFAVATTGFGGGTLYDVSSNTAPLLLSEVSPYQFLGSLDDIRIYNRVLTSMEILQLSSPPTPELNGGFNIAESLVFRKRSNIH